MTLAVRRTRRLGGEKGPNRFAQWRDGRYPMERPLPRRAPGRGADEALPSTRREFIAGLGGAAAWPFAARARLFNDLISA